MRCVAAVRAVFFGAAVDCRTFLMEDAHMDKLKSDLIKKEVARLISDNIEDFEIDVDKIADTTAINMIREIQAVLIKNPDDFEIVEEIVCIFEKYGVSAGICHDF